MKVLKFIHSCPLSCLHTCQSSLVSVQKYFYVALLTGMMLASFWHVYMTPILHTVHRLLRVAQLQEKKNHRNSVKVYICSYEYLYNISIFQVGYVFEMVWLWIGLIASRYHLLKCIIGRKSSFKAGWCKLGEGICHSFSFFMGRRLYLNFRCSVHDSMGLGTEFLLL